MPLSLIQQVRLITQDNSPGLYILSDDEITYYLEANDSNVKLAALAAAKSILLQLALRSTDKTVDVLSVKGSKAAEQYRLALELFVKSKDFNNFINNASIYAGGISNSDMQANVDNTDNNFVRLPTDDGAVATDYFST